MKSPPRLKTHPWSGSARPDGERPGLDEIDTLERQTGTFHKRLENFGQAFEYSRQEGKPAEFSSREVTQARGRGLQLVR